MKISDYIRATVVSKRCPRCQGNFRCDVQAGCWCENLNLERETLKKLRRDYIDCLCENCLKQFESDKK